MTALKQSCSRCGTGLQGDLLDGLCETCLLRYSLGIGGQPSLDDDAAGASLFELLDPSLPETARVFGDYELLEEIGAGGMGVVWRARQRSLNRPVAVKMIRAGQLARSEDIERFRTESEAVARLRHPGIVAIHEVGEVDGQHFFSMELVLGASLAECVRPGPMAPRRAATILQRLALIIQHAHARDVLHRDLKPSNILRDADDQPRVTDFGLAKIAGHASDVTRTDAIVGSPGYMAPEQAAGRSRELDGRADLHALGAILYELLTGRPPYQGDSALATLKLVVETEPVAPRQLNPGIPRDLETICLKCLEKDQAKRYDTAQELADELDRFLKDEPIRARPVSRAERVWRWCRRKPALAGALGAAALFLIAGLAGVLWQWREARQHATRAEANELKARRAQYASDMNLAHQAVQDGDFFRARQLLERHEPGKKPGARSQESEVTQPKLPASDPSLLTPDSRLLTPDLRGWEWRYLHEQSRGEEEFTLGIHTNGVRALGILPDGHTVWSAGWDNAVRLWDLRTRREIASLPHPQAIYHAAASPDGRWLVTAAWLRTELGPLRVWDLAAQREVEALGTNFWLGPNIAFSPNGKLLAFQTLIPHDGFHILDFESRRELEFLESNPRNNINPVGMAFSPDSRTFAYAAGHNGDVLLWDVATRTHTHTLTGHASHVMGLAFSPDGATLASGDIGGVMKLWDVASRRERGGFTNQGAVVRFAFSPDGTRLASGGWFQRLRLHDARDGSLLRTFQGHVDSIHGLAFTPDGATILSGSGDGSVRAWSVAAATKPPASVAFGEPLPVWDAYGPAAFLSVNGLHAVTVFTNQDFVIWDTFALRSSERIPAPLTNLTSVAIAPDGRSVAFTAWTGETALWDVHNHSIRWKTKLSEANAHHIRFSPDGSRLAWLQGKKGGWEHILVCEAATGRQLVPPIQEPQLATALAFSVDGSLLAGGLYLGDVKIWRLDPILSEKRLTGHRFQIGALALSPDHQTLVTGSQDGIRVSDAASGQSRTHLRPRPTFYRRAAFSPDGRRIAVAGGDGQITIFDSETLDELVAFKASGSPQGLAFTPDGESLVTITAQELRVWQANAGAVVSRSSDSETKGPPP